LGGAHFFFLCEVIECLESRADLSTIFELDIGLYTCEVAFSKTKMYLTIVFSKKDDLKLLFLFY